IAFELLKCDRAQIDRDLFVGEIMRMIQSLSYTERANNCPSPLAKNLLQLMDKKKTNLALAADVLSGQQLIALADQLGPEICLLKTHIDIIEDFTPDLTQELIRLARKHQFLIFEDRKLAGQFAHFVIGFITQHALSKDPHWINFTPGIKLQGGSDSLGQQYITPEEAILMNGSDVIIVGRGILAANDPVANARQYRDSA